MNITKYLKFLPIAQATRDLSKDPSTQVGAIALDDDYNLKAVGYNGFPRGVEDDEGLLANREEKYPRIVHAEANLIASAARNGVSLRNATVLLTSLYPCSVCAGLIIQAGIKRVIAPAQQENARWDRSSKISMDMFQQAGIEIYTYDEGGNLVETELSAATHQAKIARALKAGGF